MLPLVMATIMMITAACASSTEVSRASRFNPAASPNGTIASSAHQMACSGRYASTARERWTQGTGSITKCTSARETNRAPSAGPMFDIAGQST